jgi:hypothetical protein
VTHEAIDHVKRTLGVQRYVAAVVPGSDLVETPEESVMIREGRI